MDFDDWMLTKEPKYHPTGDAVALRRLRECWSDAQRAGVAAHERDELQKDFDKLAEAAERRIANLEQMAEREREYKAELLSALEGVLPFLTGEYWPGEVADAAVDRAIAIARKVGAGDTAIDAPLTADEEAEVEATWQRHKKAIEGTTWKLGGD